MATELVTRIWCDIHLTDKDEHEPATTYTWDKRQLDLCDDCAGPILEVLRLFSDYGSDGKRTRAPKGKGGAPVGTKHAQPGDPDAVTCPDCGKAFKNKGSLGSHGRHVHKKNMGELLGVNRPYPCGVCDKTFATPQGAGAHRVRSHPGAKSVAK